MEGTIRVTPQQLTTASQDFSSKGTLIGTLTSDMTTKVTSLSSVWEGEAATAYVQKFKGLEDDIQKLIRMVQEHATDLEQMAGEYSRAESEIQSEIGSLSSDVIN